MKKLISLLMCAVTLVMLAGCSKPEIIDKAKQALSTEPAKTTVSVTFPEGYTIAQTAALLEENGVCTKEDFLEAVNDVDQFDYDFIKDIKDRDKRAFILEGYIFPDTYEFYIGESAAKAVSRFLKNTDRKLTDEMYRKAEKLGYSMDEIITIASIIQKEAGIKKEMPKVSSVLHNRLNDSYNKLECDVTINYLKKYVIPFISGDDTDRYNEYYNTYKCQGLPAGAICNPGIDAINAALEPADTKYMFFVTDKTDTSKYYYAETYKEHLQNCKKAGWN
ncbi:MAG: endolytic transglycosylase MltG [Acutalibacteraceae bacterium]